MKTFVTYADTEWTKDSVPVGTILKFLGSDYEIDKRKTVLVFEVIGNPVEENPPVEIRFE